jgi:fatty acid amide hydrolase
METTKDAKILNEYMREVTEVVKQRCDKIKSKQFTEKFIRKQLDNHEIKVEDPVLSKKQLLEMSASEVQTLILEKKIKYSELVQLYHLIKKEDQNTHNSLTWSFYDVPMESACQIDDKISKMDDPKKIVEDLPLTGFVLSTKECLYLKDCPNTCGIHLNLDRVATEDPHFMQTLKNKGAVITCRGNVPQFLLSMESNNTIYGITTNPFNVNRTAGGSSGGDAVNLVQGYCNAAIGTDIAGSVRIPALFCGLVGFKPTTHRLSNQVIGYMFERRYGSDQRPAPVINNFELEVIFPNQLGVITKSVSDAEKLMTVLVEDQQYDNLVLSIPWNPQPKFVKRIGVIRKMKYFEPCVSNARAIDETIIKLQKQNYEFVEMDVEDILSQVAYWTNITYHISPYLWETIKGNIPLKEELFPMYELAKKLHSLPLWLVKIMRYFEGDSRKGHALECYLASKKYSQNDINSALAGLYKKLEKEMTNKGVSALLSVGLPLPAIKLYSSNYIMMICAYLFIFNFLKMPAGVVPVTQVREDEQIYESEYQDVFTETAKECMINSKGLPIGVQVSARSFNDEIVMQILKDIERDK